LSWLHSENIMLIADEASWIPTEIFESGQSNLTGEINFMILIWNPIRNVWFFFDAFWDDSFLKLHFNGKESPITGNYPAEIEAQYWVDSDEYRKRVLARFPREDIIDDKWYIQLITSDKIRQQADLKLYWNRKILWVDCAWWWKNLTTWVLRDNIWAIIVGSETISDENSITQKTITIMKEFWVKAEDVFFDNFGVGANVAVVMANLGYKTSPIYVWATKIWDIDIVENWQKILNIRALLYWRLKKWLENWWILAAHEWWKELEHIRYRRSLKDQIQIMSKQDMRKLWYESPDYADSLSLTFYPWSIFEDRKIHKNKIFRPNWEDYI
jgi:hypothetical protein